MNESEQRRRSGRMVVIGLAAMFFAPLVLATVWYVWFPEYAPSGQPNGELISPPRPLEPFRAQPVDGGDALTLADLRGGWRLVQLVGDRCDSACRRRAHILHQIDVALGRDSSRVERLLIARDGLDTPGVAVLARRDPRLHILRAGGGLARQFPADRHATSVFLTDPQGNLMMRYAPAVDGNGILDDLEHLLKISRPADET